MQIITLRPKPPGPSCWKLEAKKGIKGCLTACPANGGWPFRLLHYSKEREKKKENKKKTLRGRKGNRNVFRWNDEVNRRIFYLNHHYHPPLYALNLCVCVSSSLREFRDTFLGHTQILQKVLTLTPSPSSSFFLSPEKRKKKTSQVTRQKEEERANRWESSV